MDKEEILKIIKERWKIIVLVVTVLGILIGLILFLNFSRATNIKQNEPLVITSQSTSTKNLKKKLEESSSLPATEPEKIVVDVKGAVKNPKVYTVSANLRVNDVVQMAGGFTDEADQKSINLAEKLKDGQVIYVATIAEKVQSVISSSNSDNSLGTSKSPSTSTGKININTADLSQLQSLSGIGQKKAQDIIDYRTQNGPFKSIEDLGNVSGFGEKSLDKIKDSITVDK
ncbi:MAG: helix-hairpin-helix domain-containing protein [Streptococcaceae bacterium]|nr:helix-hairpin-helix domain-containing protein [Streptococcaceae bacterium]